jgi:hypothetical protein
VISAFALSNPVKGQLTFTGPGLVALEVVRTRWELKLRVLCRIVVSTPHAARVDHERCARVALPGRSRMIFGFGFMTVPPGPDPTEYGGHLLRVNWLGERFTDARSEISSIRSPRRLKRFPQSVRSCSREVAPLGWFS